MQTATVPCQSLSWSEQRESQYRYAERQLVHQCHAIGQNPNDVPYGSWETLVAAMMEFLADGDIFAPIETEDWTPGARRW